MRALGFAAVAFVALTLTDRESGPTSINVGGHLIVVSRSTLSGDRRAARMAETPYADESATFASDFSFTGRFYCFAHELYAPRWQFLASRRCKLWTFPRSTLAVRSSGDFMGPEEFHAISRCWCAMKQSTPARDDRGVIFLDRDPDLVRDVVRALRFPHDAIQALLDHPEDGPEPAFLTSGRARFCKEVEFFGIVDFMVACTGQHLWYLGGHSASAILAHDMLQLPLKDLLPRNGGQHGEVAIPLEQVVHNRLHNRVAFHAGVKKRPDNAVTESRVRLQATLDDFCDGLGYAALFVGVYCAAAWIYRTCKVPLLALRAAYFHVLLSPVFGLVMLVLLPLEAYRFDGWDPDDFVGRSCPLPRRCVREDSIEALLRRLRAVRALDRHLRVRLLQSHACDGMLASVWRARHIYHCLRAPMLLLSAGNVLRYLCGLRRAVGDHGGLVGAVAAWTSWLVRYLALGMPCLIVLLVFVLTEDPIRSRDGRYIHVIHPSDSLATFGRYATDLRQAWMKALSTFAVGVIYGG